jgi:DNA-binding IclR family transcriptional regulator
MARPAPAVQRIVAILEYLAQSPDTPRNLSQIARAADLNSATAHSTLAALTQEGLLVRDPGTKRYALGPTLARLGAAAAARVDDVIDIARPHLRALNEQFGLQVSATRVAGEHIVIEAREGEPGPWGMTVQVGQRMRLAPPLGSVFLAWAPDADVDAWVKKTPDPASEELTAACLDALAAVRERGYAVALNSPTRAREDALNAPAGLTELINNAYFLREVVPEREYVLRQIAAPIFNADGRVALSIAVMYGGEIRTGQEIVSDAAQIVASANRVTAAIHGTPPSTE